MKRKFLTLFAAIVAVSFGSAVADDSCTPLVSKAKITLSYFSAPDGCIGGKYKVSGAGEADKFVYFTEGNLQYQLNSQNLNDCKWRLAEHQYNLSPTLPTYSQSSSPVLTTSAAWIDVLQPGATGLAAGNAPLYAFSMSETKSSLTTIYDWGYQCDITNFAGTKTFAKQTFRLLTAYEWDNIFANHIYFRAEVEVESGQTQKALLIIPYGITKYPQSSDIVAVNNATWKQMEKEGVLLLPAIGYALYEKLSSYTKYTKVNNCGVYLTTTARGGASNNWTYRTKSFWLDSYGYMVSDHNIIAPSCVAIRLVKDAE